MSASDKILKRKSAKENQALGPEHVLMNFQLQGFQGELVFDGTSTASLSNTYLTHITASTLMH